MQENKTKQQAWYEEWFGKEYLEVYAHRNHQEAVSDINKVEILLNLKQAGSILDLACGSGRHSLELARKGYQVTGVDLSSHLLEVAEKAADHEGLQVPFHRSDMRYPPFESQFNIVISMFTSFGYFENDLENSKIFAAISKCLRPEGKFLMDYINKDQILANLVPEDNKKQGERTLVQKRSYNQTTKRLEKVITIKTESGEKEFLESVKLYTFDEMKAMAEKNGLLITKHFGSLNGEEFTSRSPRLVLVGKKG